MRLTDNQAVEGIKRPGKDVRYVAVRYFSGGYSRNTAAMPAVIETLDQWGADAFLSNHPIADLAQTPDTILWVLAQLSDPTLDPGLREHLSRLVRSADPRLLAPHEATIANSRTIWPELRHDCHERLRLLQLGSAALWQALESICIEGHREDRVGDVDYRGGERIVDVLALDPANAERMMPLLAETVDLKDESGKLWMECFLTLLAGEMRHEPAVPLLIEKLRGVGAVLGEESTRGLIKIGGETVVSAMRDEARESRDDIFLLGCGEVLSGVRSESAIAAGLELLAREEVAGFKFGLAGEMVGQLATETNEAVRDILLEHENLPRLKELLVAACALVGQDFPELPTWRGDVAAHNREIEGRAALINAYRAPAAISNARPAPARRLDAPAPLHAAKHVGRNDSCPCGSGKKFKKCCLTKTNASR